MLFQITTIKNWRVKMNITLANFQIKAISNLMDAMAGDKRDIVLKSPTGSGKTIILTRFIDEYCKGHAKTVFIWLTPGKGSLEEQSKAKMDDYVHGSQTKFLSDVMTSGFEENDACFINWEKLTKKGNNALKDSERTNFLEHIQKALDKGLSFKIIIDESHQNDTIKSDDIIQYFKTDKIIRCSATPKGFTNAFLIDIPEEDVVAEGLIKKVLIINENFEQNINVNSQIAYLLDKALTKQREIHSKLLQIKVDINPLIIVQIPNKSEVLQDEVEKYLESKGIAYENKQLAVWLSDKKENLKNIEKPNAKPIIVIIKQAVATGWDCPRAYILVKLRDNMGEVFEIQTIGRIRRMPEAKHYENDLLDSCYLYTLDEKFTEGVKIHLGKSALDAAKLYLKPEFKKISLISEQKTVFSVVGRDSLQAINAIHKQFTDQYALNKKANVQKKLESAGYVFSNNIIAKTKSGTISHVSADQIWKLSDVNIKTKLNTHTHGREYHHRVSDLGLKIGLEYSQMNTIIRKLFDKKSKYKNKILSLETREVYAFLLNNFDRLKEDIRRAMSTAHEQSFSYKDILEVKFKIPQEFLFTYDGESKTQLEMKKNVYRGYLSSAEPRSASEKKFEKYCELSKNVDWFYKNGDKGQEFFSIVYDDNFGKQKSFYPDYLVGISGKTWIIETKGGFDRAGNSEDIDAFSPTKFEVLKRYLAKHGLNGGFVREDKQSYELCICTENYSDDIKSTDWKILNELF